VLQFSEDIGVTNTKFEYVSSSPVPAQQDDEMHGLIEDRSIDNADL
jgi:hypothetical protein